MGRCGRRIPGDGRANCSRHSEARGSSTRHGRTLTATPAPMAFRRTSWNLKRRRRESPSSNLHPSQDCCRPPTTPGSTCTCRAARPASVPTRTLSIRWWQADATPAGALSARQTGADHHARGRAPLPCRLGADAGRPARPAHGRLRTVVAGARDHPFRGCSTVFPLSGFRLYDDLVIVESIVGEQQLAEARRRGEV